MHLDSQVRAYCSKVTLHLQGHSSFPETPVASSGVAILSSVPLLEAEGIWVPHEFGE